MSSEHETSLDCDIKLVAHGSRPGPMAGFGDQKSGPKSAAGHDPGQGAGIFTNAFTSKLVAVRPFLILVFSFGLGPVTGLAFLRNGVSQGVYRTLRLRGRVRFCRGVSTHWSPDLQAEVEDHLAHPQGVPVEELRTLNSGLGRTYGRI